MKKLNNIAKFSLEMGKLNFYALVVLLSLSNCRTFKLQKLYLVLVSMQRLSNHLSDQWPQIDVRHQ